MRSILLVSLCATLAAACANPESHTRAPSVAVAVPAPVAVAEGESPPRSSEALAALLAEYDHLLASKADPSALALARSAIDRMAGQRDAHVSRLFWYTEIEEAKAEAKRSGRPILSLRLLGRLDEELSCANSRLFRLVLYANADVSQFLRDHYVLYWSSERPVPRMTVDFGDGRVIERTLTGNSVHYVLDAQGRLVDALPGLYGPGAFERGLRASLELAQTSGALSDEESRKAVAKYHARATWALTAAWRKQLARGYGDAYGTALTTARLPGPIRSVWQDPISSSLPAALVNQATVSKADAEAPSLALLQPEITAYANWGNWSSVTAGLPVEHLDAQSVALIRDKHPRDWSTEGANELDLDQLHKKLALFERRLTDEEIRNEFALHGTVHERLSRSSRVEWASTNDFVYTRLFMTPRGDAWLGLTPTTALTGIDDDGLLPAALATGAMHAAHP